MNLPARFGRYTIERLLGRGGMGAVYLARQNDLERFVVVKVMTQEAAKDPSGLARLRREAKAAAQVSSEHVVRVYESGVEAGTPYIAMEYVEGTTVQAILAERKRLPHAEATRLILKAASGLRDVHAAHVLHRDVKPANILVGKDGAVKLADFGICKVEVARSAETLALSRAGEVMGSPDYMSPEQAEGKPLSASSDLYSLGVTYYQLLTGQLPYRGSSALATLTRAHQGNPTPPRAIVPEVPEAVEAVCLSLMARRAEDRPRDAAEAIALLAALAHSTETLPAKKSRARQSALVGLVLAAGVLAGVIFGLVLSPAAPTAEAAPSAAVAPRAPVEPPRAVEPAAPAAARESGLGAVDSAAQAMAEKLAATRATPATARPTAAATRSSAAVTAPAGLATEEQAGAELARLHAAPFVRRDAARLKDLARRFPATKAGRDASHEAAFVDAFEKSRRELVARLSRRATAELGRALEPLGSVKHSAPAAIEKDVREAQISLETAASLVEELASKAGDAFAHESLEALATSVATERSDELDVALVLLAAAEKKPLERAALARGAAKAAPLLAALRLASPAPSSRLVLEARTP